MITHLENILDSVMKCVFEHKCVFILSRIVYVLTTHTNRTTRTQNRNQTTTVLHIEWCTFSFNKYAIPYRVTKYRAIVASALAVSTMTHFWMVLLIFQHVRVFRAT